MTVASPDPVADPSGYQRHLLALLGDDDPADVQSATSGALRALVRDAGSAIAERSEPDEWSVLGCIAHVLDAELVSSVRYRWIVAHDDPPLIGYDQDRWVERLHAHDGADALLELFEPLRHANLAMWSRSTADERRRVGMHAERGPESYDLTFRLLAGHDRFHLDQARQTLDAVRASERAHAPRSER